MCMCARLCVCVHASDLRSNARKHHQPEPGFSHTIAFAFCSASCVYTMRCFATRPRPMIWKSGIIKLHEKQPTTPVECTFTQVLYNFDLPPLIKKRPMYLTTPLCIVKLFFFFWCTSHNSFGFAGGDLHHLIIFYFVVVKCNKNKNVELSSIWFYVKKLKYSYNVQ